MPGPWLDDVALYTPGPTPIHPRAAAAMAWPMRGHMDDDVLAHNDAIARDLRTLYGATDEDFTCLLSGTGTLGMEAGLANLCEPVTSVLIASNGVFGDRMVDMATRLGAEVHTVRARPGEPLDPDAVRRVAHAVRPRVLAFVHGETSTGVLNPVVDLAAVGAEVDALVSVDAVTTVGMGPFAMAAWGIDYAYTGSQKCLSAPPGVAPIGVSQRALHAIQRRTVPVVSYYADLIGTRGYWQGEPVRAYHHTVPIHLHWATGEAVREALAEGLVARASRAARVGAALLAALETVGFRAAVAAAHRLPTVLAVTLPEGLDDRSLRAALRHEDRLAVAGGLGPTAGRLWRLGLMGEGAHGEHYRRLVVALERRLGADHLTHTFDEALAAQPVEQRATPVARAGAGGAVTARS